jgi:hypothetical protein
MRSKHDFPDENDYTPDRRALTLKKNHMNSTAANTTLNRSSNDNDYKRKN